VAMADDGGSSGLLREHTGAVPPGDIRKCLVAMAAEPDAPWTRAFSRRLSYVNDHTLGNLILVVMSELQGFAGAISSCSELLKARGLVCPSTLESVTLHGVTQDGVFLHGQASISNSQTALQKVALQPERPTAYGPAIQAIINADLIVLGPGSLFTSIIPNLLVPGFKHALEVSRAETVFLCSLADVQGETWGMDAYEHLDALLSHGMDGLLDFMVVHQDGSEPYSGNATTTFERITGISEPALSLPSNGDVEFHRSRNVSPGLPGRTNNIHRVKLSADNRQEIAGRGVRLLERDLVDPLRPTWHDVNILAGVFKEILEGCLSLHRSKTSSRV
ncbi:MAG: YvcK family protein, partial [Coriobacteriia bacterium]|nr:YvcK family protein [Coriobacteriia bacterium]